MTNSDTTEIPSVQAPDIQPGDGIGGTDGGAPAATVGPEDTDEAQAARIAENEAAMQAASENNASNDPDASEQKTIPKTADPEPTKQSNRHPLADALHHVEQIMVHLGEVIKHDLSTFDRIVIDDAKEVMLKLGILREKNNIKAGL